MNDDGVIMVFLPHALIAAASTAFYAVGWSSFRQPLVWVYKQPAPTFKYARQPYAGHCLIMPFIKQKNFKVEIRKELEQFYGFGGPCLFYNVFTVKRPAWRKKPKGYEGEVGIDILDEEAEVEAVEGAASATKGAGLIPAQGPAGGAPSSPAPPDEAKKKKDRFRVEQKPVELLQMLIRRYAPSEGDIVIDPTFGTGSAGVATYLASTDIRVGQRYFFGMDSDPFAVTVANSFLKETQRRCILLICSPFLYSPSSFRPKERVGPPPKVPFFGRQTERRQTRSGGGGEGGGGRG
jgi:DNA modification methylase